MIEHYFVWKKKMMIDCFILGALFMVILWNYVMLRDPPLDFKGEQEVSALQCLLKDSLLGGQF